MKKVIGILAVVAFAANMASAELLKNAKYSGSLEVKSVTLNNTTFDADAKMNHSETAPRVTVGVNFDLNDDVNAQITAVKFDNQYGKVATAGQTIDNVTASVMFSEAYVNLKNLFGINHRLGRQYYGNAGDMVIYYGPSTNEVSAFSVSALDAWYGEWKQDKWTVSALMGKVTENSVTQMTDKDVYGVTAAYDYSEIVKPAVYVYQLDDRTAGINLGNKPNVAGVKVNGKYQGVGYGAEFAMNSGDFASGATREDYTGTALKANVDYTLEAKEAGKFAFMGEFVTASGDKGTTVKNEGFTAINSNYVPGLVFGGVRGNVGVTNLTTFNVGVNWTPKQLEKLTLGAKYYSLAYTEKVGTVDTIGNELDFTAMWKHSDNVGARATYAMLTPDSKYSAVTDAETLMGLDLVVKF